MEDPKIVFLMSHPPHCPYLVTNLYSLRKHWNGEIIVYAFPESREIVGTIARDDRLWINVRPWDPPYRGKNDQFLNKIIIAEQLDCQKAIYLDADTLPLRPFKDIVDALDKWPFVATQWNDWLMDGGLPANRIKWLLGRDKIPQSDVERALRKPSLPSVNGGVFGFWPGSQFLSKWRRYTEAALDLFIGDEIALHALVAEHYEKKDGLTVVTGGHVNCSPKYQPKYLSDEMVCIYHGHGDCFVRPQKSPKGVSIWWPIYEECLQQNIGGIADWKDSCGNKWLKKLEETPDDMCRFCWGDPVEGHHEKCPVKS